MVLRYSVRRVAACCGKVFGSLSFGAYSLSFGAGGTAWIGMRKPVGVKMSEWVS